MKEHFDKADLLVILRIIGGYSLFTALWIYLSDQAVAVLIHDPAILPRVSILKSVLFIALTSCLLTYFIARHIRTDRKAERDLRESEERYRQLFENAPDAIIVQDGNTITFANDAALRLLGAATAEQVLGKPILDFVCPDSWEMAKENTRLLLEKRKVVPLSELCVRRLDGSVIDVELVGAPITSHGNPTIQIIARDITQRKKAEQALKNLNEELEIRVRHRTAELEESRVQLKAQYEELQRTYQQVTEITEARIRAMEELREKERMMIQQSRMAAMGEMLGNIAHHWRQPLNVVGLAIQDLGLSYQTGALTKELLDSRIDKAMNVVLHLSKTIDHFTTFTAPDKGKSLFKVDQLVSKTISLVEESFREQRIAIYVSTRDAPQINGYPNEYAQVLLNIMMNARDAFLERGIIDGRITVCSWEENGRAVVTVTDNAGGIEPGIFSKIFDPYFTTKELGKGSGVGLFMSKTIIEKNMGGRLSARNTDDGVELKIEV